MNQTPPSLSPAILTACAFLTFSAVPAQAVESYWEGTANGIYTDSSWSSLSGSPGSTDTAINDTSHTVTVNGNWDVGSIQLNHGTTDETEAARFLQTSGTVTVTNWVHLGEDSNSIGIYEITGGTLTANASITDSAFRVGGNGLGILKISGEGTVVNIAPGTNGWNDALRIGNGGSIYSGSGEGRVIQTGGTVNAGRILIGQDSGGQGSYTLSGGTLNASGDAYVGGYNGTGAFTISNGTFSGYKLHVSQEGGTGTFNMTGGDATLSSWFIVGHKTGSSGGTGTATISGGTFNANHETAIGNELGTGTLTISGGTLNAASFFCIGRRGGTGIVNITGGTINQNGGDFVLGGDGTGGNSSGTVNHSAGSLISVVNIKIGANNQTNKGTYHLSDTGEIQITNNGSWFAIGSNGTEGVLNMIGGSFTHKGTVDSGETTSRISVGDGKRADGSTYTEGTVNQSGGTFTATGVDTDIGRNGGTGVWNLSGTGEATLRTLNLGTHTTESTGTFNLNSGGKLTLSGLNIGYSGSSAFNFNGGTLIASADMTVAGGGAINVLASGGTIDNGGHTIAFEQALTGAGDLTLKGSGTFNLSVACALTGTVTVEQGTLLLSDADALDGLSGLSFASGTALELNYDGTANLGFLLVNGTYVAAGEYTLTELQDYLSANGLDSDLTLIDGGQGDYSKISITAVPEPSTYALAGFAGLALLAVLRRRKKA